MSYRGPVRERLSAVFAGGRQGSGYFLTPRLILTAAHTVAGELNVKVAIPGFGKVRCNVVWMRHDERCDVALLVADHPIQGGTAPFPDVRLGSIDSLAPLPNCQAIGFPQAQRDDDGHLDTEQLVGTLKPGSNLLSRRYVLDSSHTPPAKQRDVSPWSGFSGAALFYSDVIIGVVGHDPANWQHGRVEATSVAEFYDDPAFKAVLEEYGSVEYLSVPDDLSPDRVFEERYRDYIATKFGTLTIFGIDLNDRSQAEWPLDAAYLSLEATGYRAAKRRAITERESIAATPQSVLPADRALVGHDRVLLRGVAGSGKTTLVQWLAVSTAKQELNRGLQHLYDRVPFVLPLRTLIRHSALPLPEEFLASARSPLSGLQPRGWTERVLLAQRGLVLVDGLDEISEADRERVRSWLRELLIAFPGNSWLVTSRPSAVSDDWLASEDFVELSLSPMSHKDVATFVRRWHSAACATCRDTDELSRLTDYQNNLIAALRSKQDLGRLATNPLMCGLICALHRDRRGYLPPGRKQLYDAALSMLLARRDRERDLDVQILEETQIQLLQKLAYWLIRNGQVEMDRSDAFSIIAAALPAMPALAQLGEAEQVYRYLLLRSGVLREPTDGVMDFIHRTFQDYLGAKAAVEERDFDLMVRNAHHDQWEDVIRMAVAHAYPAERTRLLNKLIKRGDRVKRHKTRLYLLAMACLDQATELDPEIRLEIEKRASELIPPGSYEEAEHLASAGPMVLDLLPGPEGLSAGQARAVVDTITFIGTDAALPALARFRDQASADTRDQLARAWYKFDIRGYGQEIIAHLPEETLFWVKNEGQLRFLQEVGGRPEIIVNGDHAKELLEHALNRRILRRFGIHANRLIDSLDFLSSCAELRALFLFDCPLITDLTPINEMQFEELSINSMDGLSGGFRGLRSMRHVKRLGIMQPIPGADLSSLPGEASIVRVSFSKGALANTGLRGLSEFVSIEELWISETDELSSEDWREAGKLPKLNSLGVDKNLVPGLLEYRKSWPKVEWLRFLYPGRRASHVLGVEEFRKLASRFPNLRRMGGILTRGERSDVELVFENIEFDNGPFHP
ncbi:NACHT domain-containing protein [Streptomyces sp. NBC_00519]|uniref:NACHT domain-containing protein n=1 Tax=Streptomyces sp. NBC_00519 TaxID=2975764 RepID=UPI0030E1E7CB